MTQEIPDRVKAIERLYREGLTQAQIASQCGLSKQSVGRLLGRWCDVREIGRANRAAKRQKTGLDKALDKTLEMYQAGMTFQEIADFIGVTRHAVAGYVFRQKRKMDQ